MIAVKPTQENRLFDHIEEYTWSLADGIRGKRPEYQAQATAILRALEDRDLDVDELKASVVTMLYGSDATVDMLEHRRLGRALRQLRALGAVRREKRSDVCAMLPRGREILRRPDLWFDRERLPMTDFEIATLRHRRRDAAIFAAGGCGFFFVCQMLDQPGLAMAALILLAIAAQSVFVSSIENGSYWVEMLPWDFTDAMIVRVSDDADVMRG